MANNKPQPKPPAQTPDTTPKPNPRPPHDWMVKGGDDKGRETK